VKCNKTIVYTDISKVTKPEIKLLRNIYVYTKIWTKLKINILKEYKYISY
jgi:hypothetical protein